MVVPHMPTCSAIDRVSMAAILSGVTALISTISTLFWARHSWDSWERSYWESSTPMTRPLVVFSLDTTRTLPTPGKSCNLYKLSVIMFAPLVYDYAILSSIDKYEYQLRGVSTLRRVSYVRWFMCLAAQWIPWTCGSLAVDGRFLHA